MGRWAKRVRPTDENCQEGHGGRWSVWSPTCPPLPPAEGGWDPCSERAGIQGWQVLCQKGLWSHAQLEVPPRLGPLGDAAGRQRSDEDRVSFSASSLPCVCPRHLYPLVRFSCPWYSGSHPGGDLARDAWPRAALHPPPKGYPAPRVGTAGVEELCPRVTQNVQLLSRDG